MDSDAEDALLDILEFAEELRSFVADQGQDRPEIERMRFRAVERMLLLIGEAWNRATAADPSLVLAIPNPSKIRGMRNRLAHEYDGIRADIVWDTATSHIPALVDAILELLGERNAPA